MREKIKEQFFEAWDEDNHEKMVSLLKTYLDIIPDHYNDDIDKVGKLKNDFESDLPHRVVSEAVGCDIDTCRQVRYRGDDYGAVKRYSSSRKSIPPSLREAVYERDNRRCVRCSSDIDLEIHHVIPVSHGGLNFKENLTVLCSDCNYDAHGGDYSSRRTVYDGKDEFWNSFIEGYGDSE